MCRLQMCPVKNITEMLLDNSEHEHDMVFG